MNHLRRQVGTGELYVPGSAFVPSSGNANNWKFSSGGIWGGASQGLFHAPVVLPTNAHITAFAVYGYHNDPAHNFKPVLKRSRYIQGNEDGLALIDFDRADQIQIKSSDSVSNPVVDNTYSYYVEVELNEGQRVYGAIVYYGTAGERTDDTTKQLAGWGTARSCEGKGGKRAGRIDRLRASFVGSTNGGAVVVDVDPDPQGPLQRVVGWSDDCAAWVIDALPSGNHVAIVEFDGKRIDTIKDLEHALSRLPENSSVTMKIRGLVLTPTLFVHV